MPSLREDLGQLSDGPASGWRLGHERRENGEGDWERGARPPLEAVLQPPEPSPTRLLPAASAGSQAIPPNRPQRAAGSRWGSPSSFPSLRGLPAGAVLSC